jgi:hypothetical protein
MPKIVIFCGITASRKHDWVAHESREKTGCVQRLSANGQAVVSEIFFKVKLRSKQDKY